MEGVPPWLSVFVIDLGGSAGGLGSQPERTVFQVAEVPALRVAPVICYESVYGDFVGEYVANGATLIGIITNDGWWSDSPGHSQHLQYATLRAIETRRDVARSANTGISAFINQKGEITQQTRLVGENGQPRHRPPQYRADVLRPPRRADWARLPGAGGAAAAGHGRRRRNRPEAGVSGVA